MGRTVKPFTKGQKEFVSDLQVKIANLAVDTMEKDEAIGQLATAAAFASQVADQRLNQLRDVTPTGDNVEAFVNVNGDIVLRTTKTDPAGTTDVQVHFLCAHDAYNLGQDLLDAANEVA